MFEVVIRWRDLGEENNMSTSAKIRQFIAEPPFSLDNFNVCTISTQQKNEFWNPFFGLWLETPPAWWSFVHNSSSGRWQTWASNFVGKQPSSFCFYNQKIRILGSFALKKKHTQMILDVKSQIFNTKKHNAFRYIGDETSGVKPCVLNTHNKITCRISRSRSQALQTWMINWTCNVKS